MLEIPIHFRDGVSRMLAKDANRHVVKGHLEDFKIGGIIIL